MGEGERPGCDEDRAESRERAKSESSLSLGLCSLLALALANLACLFGCPRSASAGRQVDDLEAMHAREGRMENGGKTGLARPTLLELSISRDSISSIADRLDAKPRLLLAFAPLRAGRTRWSRGRFDEKSATRQTAFPVNFPRLRVATLFGDSFYPGRVRYSSTSAHFQKHVIRRASSICRRLAEKRQLSFADSKYTCSRRFSFKKSLYLWPTFLCALFLPEVACTGCGSIDKDSLNLLHTCKMNERFYRYPYKNIETHHARRHRKYVD